MPGTIGDGWAYKDVELPLEQGRGGGMASDIPERTLRFAGQVLEVCLRLEKRSGVARRIAKQLFDASSSVGANIAEGQGAQSEADFLAKYCIALKEAREAHYWLRVTAANPHLTQKELPTLISEANELVAILTATVKTLKARLGRL
jgi:four helix bundle protein